MEVYKKIKQFIINWSEVLTLPLAIILWALMGPILRSIDETAGIIDIGILQAFFTSTIGILFGHALIWLILKISGEGTYEILDDFLKKNSQSLSPWQKGQFSLYYWGFLLLAWAILVVGLA